MQIALKCLLHAILEVFAFTFEHFQLNAFKYIGKVFEILSTARLVLRYIST